MNYVKCKKKHFLMSEDLFNLMVWLYNIKITYELKIIILFNRKTFPANLIDIITTYLQIFNKIYSANICIILLDLNKNIKLGVILKKNTRCLQILNESIHQFMNSFFVYENKIKQQEKCTRKTKTSFNMKNEINNIFSHLEIPNHHIKFHQ